MKERFDFGGEPPISNKQSPISPEKFVADVKTKKQEKEFAINEKDIIPVGNWKEHKNDYEWHEDPEFRIALILDTPANRALQKLFEAASPSTKVEILRITDNLAERVKTFRPDTILMMEEVEMGQDEVIRIATQLRNIPEITKQPVLMAMGFNREQIKRMLESGIDIGIEERVDLVKLFEGITSVPEALADLEDHYGDQMLRNKRAFYQAFGERLAARSEITADIGQELQIIEAILTAHGAKKLLDAGGGAGRISIPLAEKGYQVLNLDASPELLKIMRKQNGTIPAVVGNLHELPLRDEGFDAVMYNWHVFCDILGRKRKKQVLSEAFRTLKPGGVIIFDIPSRDQAEFRKDGVYIHQADNVLVFVGYVPSEEEMKKFLEETGFQHIQIKHWQTKNGYQKVTFSAEKPKS